MKKEVNGRGFNYADEDYINEAVEYTHLVIDHQNRDARLLSTFDEAMTAAKNLSRRHGDEYRVFTISLSMLHKVYGDTVEPATLLSKNNISGGITLNQD